MRLTLSTAVSAILADGVLVVTIDNPPVNAASTDMRVGLAAAIEHARGAADVQAVVITGAGKTFVGGADIKEFGAPPTEPLLPDLVQAIEASDKPVVAAINGAALGGGLEIALACHRRIAAPEAKLGLPEVKLGIVPGAGGTQRLPRLVGIERAAEMIRSCKPIGSDKALAWGLIKEEVDGDVVARAVQLAVDLATGKQKRSRMDAGPMPNVPSSLPAVEIGHLSKKVDEIIQKAILQGCKLPLKDGLALEAKCFGEVCGTEDMKIGTQNFMKNGPKVKAVFVHR